jgi:hypothetical protein
MPLRTFVRRTMYLLPFLSLCATACSSESKDESSSTEVSPAQSAQPTGYLTPAQVNAPKSERPAPPLLQVPENPALVTPSPHSLSVDGDRPARPVPGLTQEVAQ